MKAMTLRLPDDVHERLRQEAHEQRTSITALIVEALTRPAPVADREEASPSGLQVSPSLGVADREELAALLTRLHFDGQGCGTHGVSACSNCAGPSPLSAHEIADVLIAAGYVATPPTSAPLGVADREEHSLLIEKARRYTALLYGGPQRDLIQELADALDGYVKGGQG